MGSPAQPLTQAGIRATLREAVALHVNGRLDEALRLYEEILHTDPGQFDALHLSGVVAALTGNPAKAADLIGRAIAVDPSNAAAYNNRGRALSELRRWEEALDHYGRAATLQAGYAEPHCNSGNVLKDLGRWEDALRSYDRCLALDPGHVDACCGRGIALMALKRHDAAVASFDRAVGLRQDSAEAHYHRGNALCEMHDWHAALASYDRAIQAKSDFAEAHSNRGFVLGQLQQFEAALASWDLALALDPALGYLRGERCFARMRLCDWSELESDRRALAGAIELGETVCAPFAVLAWSASAALHKTIAASWVRERWPADPVLGPISRRAAGRTIRLGYFSTDFHDHATAHLIAGLLERHDRSRFEVVAFSFGPDVQDVMRRRLVAACDQFIDVRLRSDVEVATLARQMQIDIAIDLKGYTQGHRLGIFALRAAPVQVNYLGYPGTSGAGYMDYIIGDEVLVPEQSQRHFTEKIAYLPGSYQVNDAGRVIAEQAFTRAELGLPQNGCVFCCFNNNFKITPEMFAIWMRILARVDGSVLWLLADNPTAVRNLRREAARHRIDPERLVFAPRMPLPEHLARHRAADLFLDTLPYNAHTTASDALWAGLPVLTCPGEGFASRVAASVLASVGLPELIASSLREYEDTAVRLAAEPGCLTEIRRSLVDKRRTAPLFDIRLYAERIEAAYFRMHQRQREGLPPAHIRS
jgi:predicted O-linked N-acetylglucosamine transferase (SPINDLY family)